MNILDLGPAEFLAALDEHGIVGPKTLAALMA